MAMLRRESPYDHSIIPHVILLDLNMPQMDGRQFLSALKQDAFLKLIPAMILSTSAAGDDISNAYSNHASAYMTKPIELHEFRDRIRRFADFWLAGIQFAQFELR
jgi:CheY-like chemotaxis protein